MTHSTELVDADNDIYECTRCKKRGHWRDFIGTSCEPDDSDDDEINLSNNRSYGIFGPGSITGNSILGGSQADPID